jgi:branched-subunit amino acid aminotransferase/4-amino-4-deoxychorismate lyase
MNFKLSNKISEHIWINGEIIPWDEAYIHVLTHGLHYAGAV